MCDARTAASPRDVWGYVERDPDFENLLKDVLDNLVDLPHRDGSYVRMQLIAFANCVRQLTRKDTLFETSERLTTEALKADQWSLKLMTRKMREAEDAIRSKTSGGNTTSVGDEGRDTK